MKEFTFSSFIALAATTVTAFLGGWDDALRYLITFLVIDYGLGVLVAIKTKKLNSDIMFWGGIRKAVVLIVIAIAVMLDNIIGNQAPVFRTMAIYFYTAREGLSAIENVGLLGLPLPAFVRNVLTQLQGKGDKEDEKGNDK